jgi:AraC-like DNA-binding protein
MEIRDVVHVRHLVGHERVNWHGRFHNHGPGEYEIVFFLEGSGDFLIDGHYYPIAAGRFFLSPPLIAHCIMPSHRGKPITYYAILFYIEESQDADMAALISKVYSQRHMVKTTDCAYSFQCEEISELFRSGKSPLAKAAEFSLFSLLYRVYSDEAANLVKDCGTVLAAPPEESAEKTDCPPYGKKDYPRLGYPYESQTNPGIAASSACQTHIAKALAIMKNQLNRNIGMEEIAAMLKMSQEHFSRIFKQVTRMNPHQYYMRLKIEAASGVLISSNKLISEIADMFGYENQFHFSRVFKQYTGLSPAEYRNHYLQTVDFLPE